MKLMIIGASGHGKVIADIAEKSGYTEIVFYDDDENKKKCGKWPVLGDTSEVRCQDGDLFIAIGDSNLRKFFMEQYDEKNIVTLIHPDAVVAEDLSVGKGTAIMAGTVINPGCRIGVGTIINTCSSVDHDCVIGDFCHIAVGAHICGTVNIEDNVWIGAGVTVSNNIHICKNAVIGAGALVVKKIDSEGTYIGVPTRKMSKNNII